MKKESIGSNLARQGKVDVRRDTEQNEKLMQAIKLLIDAGYHRARVKGLSSFDKIVGGMTWCIEVCNFDIDIDLLFHENLTIGQKIALTEIIVRVLPYMKCPYRIEPHQIQGLDCIHIYPVIEWLVTEAIKTRAEYQDETRVIALYEFRKYYEPTLNKEEERQNTKRIIYLNDIKTTYGPKRRFKPDFQSVENASKPLTTLLEYSESFSAPLHVDSDTESIDEEDKEITENLCERMSEETSTSTRLSSDVVSRMVETQVENIALETRKYFGKQKNETSLASANIVRELKIQNQNIKKEIERKFENLHIVEAKENNIKQQIKKTRDEVSKIVKEINEIDNLKSCQNEATMTELSQLLEENTSLRAHTSSFKEKCRQEAEELRQSVNELNSALESENENISEDLQQSFALESEKLKKVKMLVAKKTKEVELLKRIIDDVPGRAELFQYQRRFIELYNLVGAEHHETLQFFNMYNALTDSLSYMRKEHDLLNSILDNMEQGLSTDMDEYINQLRIIIEGITQNKVKLENKRSEERAQRVALSNEVHRLQDLQIYYARILHLFLQEIGTNELLLENKERKKSVEN